MTPPPIPPPAKRPASEIVNEMMAKYDPPSRKEFKEKQHATAYGMFGEMPKHRQLVCAVVTGLAKREKCADTFKTWGTGEEIAANMFKAELPSESPSILSRFFPCSQEPQSQLSSDVLE